MGCDFDRATCSRGRSTVTPPSTACTIPRGAPMTPRRTLLLLAGIAAGIQPRTSTRRTDLQVSGFDRRGRAAARTTWSLPASGSTRRAANRVRHRAGLGARATGWQSGDGTGAVAAGRDARDPARRLHARPALAFLSHALEPRADRACRAPAQPFFMLSGPPTSTTASPGSAAGEVYALNPSPTWMASTCCIAARSAIPFELHPYLGSSASP